MTWPAGSLCGLDWTTREGIEMDVLDLRPRPGQGVYVYQFPVRLWHWTIAACVFSLFVTGHFIGNPPQSLTGDPTYVFYFGYLVMAHFTAGFVLCLAMLCRILFAFVGNDVSRQVFILPVWQRSWWHGLLDDIKWYAFIKKRPDVYMGHNPLAQAGMFACVMGLLFMCITGLGIYQAKGYCESFGLFSFMSDLAYAAGGNGFDLVLWHRLGMSAMLVFVAIHLYMVVREEIMGRTTLVSTMINGYRLVRKTGPDSDGGRA